MFKPGVLKHSRTICWADRDDHEHLIQFNIQPEKETNTIYISIWDGHFQYYSVH